MAAATEVAGTWLGIVYARPDLPPVKQRDVLIMLVVRCAEDGPDRRQGTRDKIAEMFGGRWHPCHTLT